VALPRRCALGPTVESGSTAAGPIARSARPRCATGVPDRIAVGAPPGYRSYYVNVMAGPPCTWAFHNDPAHEWLLAPAPATH